MRKAPSVGAFTVVVAWSLQKPPTPVRHFLCYKSHCQAMSTKSIELLSFEKVGRCLRDPAEGRLLIVYLTWFWLRLGEPLGSLEALLLRWHQRKKLNSAVLGHLISLYYFVLALVRSAIGTEVCSGSLLHCCVLFSELEWGHLSHAHLPSNRFG